MNRWRVRQVKGPKTRGSAVVRFPHWPMAQLEMEGSRTTPHSTVSCDEAVGDCVGPTVGGAGDGVGGATWPQGLLVAMGAQSVIRCVGGWVEGEQRMDEQG